jgi:hypothetical protein
MSSRRGGGSGRGRPDPLPGVPGSRASGGAGAGRPSASIDSFYDVLELLTTGPYPDDHESLGVLPHKEPGKPNAFTVPFHRGQGLLIYQVMIDMPLIKLIDLALVGTV